MVKVLDVKVAVNNCPEKELGTGYMVARLVDSNLWYFGHYNSMDRAAEVAVELGNGVILGIYRKEKNNG